MFGGAEEDKGEGIRKERTHKLIKDEFGRWVDPEKKLRALERQKAKGKAVDG